jgi:WD40 repeat protein
MDNDQPLPPRFKLVAHENFALTLELDIVGKRLISGGGDHWINVWNLETGDLLRMLIGHKTQIKALKIMHTRAFGTGGTMLLSGEREGSLKVWDLDSGQCLTTISGFEEGVRTIDYCKSDPDIVVVGSYDGVIRVARISTGQIERVIVGHSSYVFALRLFKNDTLIVSASGDRTVRYWDNLTGRQIASIKAHKGMIISLDISADETLLATGSEDKHVTVWDLNTRAKIASFTAGDSYVDHSSRHCFVASRMSKLT